MKSALREAHKIIFNEEPGETTEEWELAREVLANWNVPKLGEDLAKRCIFEIVNHVEFPEGMTREMVGEAEEKGVELFPEIGDRDPHMAIYEWLEYRYWEGQEKEDKKDQGQKIKIR